MVPSPILKTGRRHFTAAVECDVNPMQNQNQISTNFPALNWESSIHHFNGSIICMVIEVFLFE